MDRKAMYKLSYGLFILTAKEAEKDNGYIIYLTNYFILRSNTYSGSEDKSDLNEYPSLSNF